MALSGPSGSGKTTLLNIVGALDRQDEGDVQILGKSLNAMSFDDMTQLRRNTIGFIFLSFKFKTP